MNHKQLEYEEIPFEPELDKMFRAVYKEWGDVLADYQVYTNLFGDSNKVRWLNMVEPCMGYIQGIMGERIILGLRRLLDTDIPKYPNNASARKLEQYLGDKSSLKEKVKAKVKAEVKRCIDEADCCAKSAKTFRDKKLAHNDIMYKYETTGVSMKHTKEALDAVHGALQAISMAYKKEALVNGSTVKVYPLSMLSFQLERLIKGVLFIDSLIDPTGEIDPHDESHTIASLNMLGVEPITEQHEEKFRKFKLVAQSMRRRMDEARD